MMTLEQIRERNRKENAAARRLQAAGYRLALAVLHPGRFWTFAGGVRFSTLPGSALCVGLELSEL